jgi:integrase
MQKNITADLVKNLKPILKPKPRPYEVWDTELKGFVVRVQPSGVKTYLVEYARHKRIAIGQASAISASEARKEAGKKIADFIKGVDPLEERKAARAFTLESFIAEKYKQWAEANMTSSRETLRKIASFYAEFGNKKLPEITAWSLEKYRSTRLRNGTSPSTANREMDTLRAAFNKAIEWGLMKTNPVSMVKHSRVDSLATVRYMDDDEDKRLRDALDAREAKRRQDRENFNQWRRERNYKEFPSYGHFTDHLKPMVLVALNTGMRRGELFNLKWTDINFVGRILTVSGRTAKSGKTRHIPLNDETFAVLQKWYEQRKDSELVFPSYDGQRMDSISTSWARLMKDAKIQNFRFHDCRHDFASKLVMAGVDLNTVRELLGHSDIKMTLRYAHLAPQKLAAAVAKLGVAR